MTNHREQELEETKIKMVRKNVHNILVLFVIVTQNA